jgi:hypothetical protein
VARHLEVADEEGCADDLDSFIARSGRRVVGTGYDLAAIGDADSDRFQASASGGVAVTLGTDCARQMMLPAFTSD